MIIVEFLPVIYYSVDVRTMQHLNNNVEHFLSGFWKLIS